MKGKRQSIPLKSLYTIAVYVILIVTIVFTLYSQVRTERLAVQLFDPAPETIRSPITIEDPAATERERKEVMDGVEDVYQWKDRYREQQVDRLNVIFRELTTVIDDEKLPFPKKFNKLKDVLAEKEWRFLSDAQWRLLLQASSTELEVMQETLVTAVNQAMSERIAYSDIGEVRQKVAQELAYANVSVQLMNTMKALANGSIIPNVVYDKVATDQQKKAAADQVEAIRILEGQIIVERGQIVTQPIYDQLQLVGLLNQNRSILPVLGIVALILFLFVFLTMYVQQFQSSLLTKSETYLFMAFLIGAGFIVILLIRAFQSSATFDLTYLAPLTFPVMIGRLFLNEKLTFLLVIMFSFLGSILFNTNVFGVFQLSFSWYMMFSGMVVIFLVRHRINRTALLRIGAIMAAVNVGIVLMLMFLKSGFYSWQDLIMNGLLAAGSALLSSVLTLGIVPVFESLFRIVSPLRLVELSNPNHPLLRKILMEAPGTYHHSLMVANLADVACEAIGANGLLARVASYYHDIGKTVRPHYFIENQMGQTNPHNQLTPKASASLIISHVVDGVAILRQYKMPKEIIAICQQHHGTTLMKYFYHQAKLQEEVDERDFRYPGPIPQTKEAAVVSIADSVEAAVRSLKAPTKESISALVTTIVADKMNDGQFDQCTMTLRDIARVKETLCQTLYGTFHSRIEYPEERKGEHVKH